MKTDKSRKEAGLRIMIAIALHGVYWRLTFGGKSPGGIGAFVGITMVYLWVSGFIMYARSKNRSELIGILLALFAYPGLIFLLIIKDKNTSKNKTK